jgi:valyl-tRNA synthetase
VYYAIIRLIAPYLPHITEEIYQEYFKQFEKIDSVNTTQYPESNQYKQSENGEKTKSDFENFLFIVEYVRKFKTEKQISM